MPELTTDERLAPAVRVVIAGLGRSEEARQRLGIPASTQDDVDSAITELHRAWLQEGRPMPAQLRHGDLLEWVGVDAETFNRAMREAGRRSQGP